MFEQIPMPNNIVTKEQTAPGVKSKKGKEFQPEGEKRAGEPIKHLESAEDDDYNLEETAVVELLGQTQGDRSQLIATMRRTTQRLFEYAVIAGDEESAYIHVCNAARYQLPEYSDIRENFLKFTKKLLIQGEERLGESRRTRLKKLMAEVGSKDFAEKVKPLKEEEEIGFQDEVSPYEETGAPLVKIGHETIGADFYQGDTNHEVRQIVIERTPTLFTEAIEAGNEILAFMQLFNAKRYRLSEYPIMRKRFLQLVEYLLNEPAEELGEARKKEIERLQEVVKKQTMVEVRTPSQLNEKSKQELREEHSNAQRESVPSFFGRAMKEKDVYWAYEHLKKASAMELPEYEKMRDQLLSLLGWMMDRGHDYYEEMLAKDSSIIKAPTYEKWQQGLRTMVENIGRENFTT